MTRAALLDGVRHTEGAEVNVAYRVAGEGPAVVLLHGTSANLAVWHPVTEALAGEATVVALDQRGHGRSDSPENGYGADDFVADVTTVLDELNLEQAVVVGHSLGARNAWVFAAQHPERTLGVLAVDYVPFVEPGVLDELAVRVAGGDRTFSSIDEIDTYLQARYPRVSANALHRRALAGYERREGGYRPLATPNALAHTVNGLRTDYPDELMAVASPLTLIRGADSKIVSANAWARAQELRPDARWMVDDSSDHYVPEENPHLIIAEIRRLLATH
ncbi:alpha/beta hydrolase [Salinibacterium sp. ZJ454]|uniref:alpha/beta fold hydrolase n=1 Tax=Salinibacterium sp. ZJ454 TaxID=2708339 RepID=UPI001422952D|nr:alpha/beta hydrolase [Salinibacterium sp. ZJ454]